jgi:hypothetical protein
VVPQALLKPQHNSGTAPVQRVPHCAVLCRTVPCRALPCCAVPCGAVPCCAVLCRAVLCCAVPCRAVLCCAVSCLSGVCGAAGPARATVEALRDRELLTPANVERFLKAVLGVVAKRGEDTKPWQVGGLEMAGG